MKLILGDIVTMKTDAIATSAHSDLRPTAGISEAIFRAADREKLMAACRRIGHCPIGRAVVTPSCGLSCRYIIHVAGPGWYSGARNERILFAHSYLRALQKAWTYHCRSVALPLMFSGEYHLPRAQALELVCQVVSRFESEHPGLDILLVLYKPGIYRLARKLCTQAGCIPQDA